MFIESYIDARNARLLEKGRQKGRLSLADQLRSKISSTSDATISKEEALHLIDEALNDQ